MLIFIMNLIYHIFVDYMGVQLDIINLCVTPIHFNIWRTNKKKLCEYGGHIAIVSLTLHAPLGISISILLIMPWESRENVDYNYN